MDRLWAPWRMEFIRAAKGPGCFLCEAVAAPVSEDRRNLLLLRSGPAFVIMNRFPYNNGHLMVAPTRHEGRLEALREEELAELVRLARLSVRALSAEMRAEGFNIGLNLGRAAGAGVADHLHLHVVPRWLGDTNFMPVIADCHVIPQALDELYGRLAPVFERLRTERPT